MKLADLLEKTVARSGKPSAKMLDGFGPVPSGQVRRVAALPRRPVAPDPELRTLLNRWLLDNPQDEELKDSQARAIAECIDRRGGLIPLGVGHGKGHIAWLLAEAVARELGITRTVILVPSGLRDSATKRKAHLHSQGWGLHNVSGVQVVGYEELQQARNVDLLERLDPDCIIADEAHNLRRRTSARTKRFLTFMRNRQKSGRPVMFVAMSGTLMKKTPIDYWELAKYALGEDGSPLPQGWPELNDWVQAITPGPGRSPPGALAVFQSSPAEDLADAFGRRVRETPGIISTNEVSVDASLVCRYLSPEMSPRVRDAVAAFEQTWEVPGGPSAVDHLGFDRLMHEVSLGYWTRIRFDSSVQEREYRDAAKAWRETVRRAGNAWSKRLDSDLRVRNAIDAGEFEGADVLAKWRIVSEFERRTHCEVFDSDWIVGVVRAWLAPTQAGLVWVERVDLGERLAKALGVPYLGAGADSEAFTEPAAIISARAHGTGKNLQHQFSRNLILSPSPSGSYLEQLIGRTHRDGQPEDTVYVDFLTHTEWARAKVDDAREDAKNLGSHSGQEQRLSFAEWEHVKDVG